MRDKDIRKAELCPPSSASFLKVPYFLLWITLALHWEPHRAIWLHGADGYFAFSIMLSTCKERKVTASKINCVINKDIWGSLSWYLSIGSNTIKNISSVYNSNASPIMSRNSFSRHFTLKFQARNGKPCRLKLHLIIKLNVGWIWMTSNPQMFLADAIFYGIDLSLSTMVSSSFSQRVLINTWI